MKTKLVKFHFLVLLILVVNFIITLSFDVGLNNYIKIGLKILLYGSALIGAILFFKPFKIVTAYFSLYVISPLLIFLAVITDRIMGLLLSGLFLGLFYTTTPVYEQDNYEVHDYSSFESRETCCLYEIYEVDYLFARKKGEFNYLEYTIINGEEVESLGSFLEKEKIKNIKIEKDSIFIDFNSSISRAYKLEKDK